MKDKIKLDKKDLKILSELDKDARQTDSKIAKKVRASKQVVNYRIQQLLKKNIIENFYTVVNVGKFGISSHYLFLQFEGLNKLSERKLLEKLKGLGFVGWLVSGTGRWDAVCLVYSRSISEFSKCLNKIIETCGKNLHEYDFTTLISAEHISYKFHYKKNEDYTIRQTEKINNLSLKKIYRDILPALSQDARISIVDLSSKIKSSAHIANYNLKKLVREKIIEGFKPKINVGKLGYQWYLLLIDFQIISEERKKEFFNFCKHHKNIYYLTNTIGRYNLMLDIHVNSVEDFKEVLLELKDKFSDVIKLYESLTIFEEFKIDYFPRALM